MSRFRTHNPFSDLLPSRTPGPLGTNDGGDPFANAEPGDTPGSLGVNDRAAWLASGKAAVPARILHGMTAGAAPLPKFRLLPDLEIDLPETALSVFEHPENVLGGGNFEIHFSGCDALGNRTQKEPDVTVGFNESTHQYELSAISIYSLKIVHNPNPLALPRVGVNVTNDRTLGIRTPPKDPKGRGYWKDVIENMRNYRSANVRPLQWYAPESTAYHEETHNADFRSYVKQNKKTLLKRIEREINGQLDYEISIGSALTLERVTRFAKQAIHAVIPHGTLDEKNAYRKTFDAKWKPVIDKIVQYADANKWH